MGCDCVTRQAYGAEAGLRTIRPMASHDGVFRECLRSVSHTLSALVNLRHGLHARCGPRFGPSRCPCQARYFDERIDSSHRSLKNLSGFHIFPGIQKLNACWREVVNVSGHHRHAMNQCRGRDERIAV